MNFFFATSFSLGIFPYYTSYAAAMLQGNGRIFWYFCYWYVVYLVMMECI